MMPAIIRLRGVVVVDQCGFLQLSSVDVLDGVFK